MPRSIPAYASLVRYGDAGIVRRQCERALELGFRHVKLHEIDPQVIAAAREVIGPEAVLMVDANCAWTLGEAIGLVPALRASNILWIEEPVFPPDDYDAMRLIEASGLAVGAGENTCTEFDFRRLTSAVRYPQPSITKVGGVSEFTAVCQTAASNGKSAMPTRHISVRGSSRRWHWRHRCRKIRCSSIFSSSLRPGSFRRPLS